MKRGNVMKGVLILKIFALAAITNCKGFNGEETAPRSTADIRVGCDGNRGCISIDDEYHKAFVKPSGELILPRMTMVQYLEVGDKSIENSTFDFRKPTKFILHGWLEYPEIDWIKNMKNELLKHHDCNVIVVDWANGSNDSYVQAAANSKIVALRIADFIQRLMLIHQLELEKLHLIGFSLGAHMAGAVGKMLASGVGRITGLDPAKPIFENLSSHHRLDPTDAVLVDVIHTDTETLFPDLEVASGYGISQPSGHLDFYPNNGFAQPGCPRAKELISAIKPLMLTEGLDKALFSCSHSRSVQLFIESINSECQFVAWNCSDYETFLRGECYSCTAENCSNRAVMGYHADTNPPWPQLRAEREKKPELIGLKFFLSTAGQYPYCHRLHRLVLQLREFPNETVEGSLNVTLYGGNGNITYNTTLYPASGRLRKLESGAEMYFIVPFTANEADTLLNTVRVEVSRNDAANPVSNSMLEVVNFSIDQTIVPNEAVKQAVVPIKLCPANHTNYAAIGKGSGAIFDVKC